MPCLWQSPSGYQCPDCLLAHGVLTSGIFFLLCRIILISSHLECWLIICDFYLCVLPCHSLSLPLLPPSHSPSLLTKERGHPRQATEILSLWPTSLMTAPWFCLATFLGTSLRLLNLLETWYFHYNYVLSFPWKVLSCCPDWVVPFVSSVLSCITPDSAFHYTPLGSEGSTFLLVLEEKVPNLQPLRDSTLHCRPTTSLITFLILSGSILMAFSFFSGTQSHWADPGSAACLTRVHTVQVGLKTLTATYWLSDLCGPFVAPLTALSRLDSYLSCPVVLSWKK